MEHSDKQKEIKNELVINYLTLRKVVGILGILLPFVLLAGLKLDHRGVEISISHCYHTNMRDILIGVLCAEALFLLSYNGYKAKLDGIVSKLAGLFALGVAFIPTIYKDPSLPCNPRFDPPMKEIIHLSCGALFFVALGIMSLVIFTKREGQITKRKYVRNVIYRVCGIGIFLSLIIMVLYFAVPGWKCKFYNYKPIFLFESLGLILFGISWLVKGEALLKDKPQEDIKIE